MSSLTSQTNLSITRTKKLLEANFRQFMEYGPGNYLPLSMWGHAGIGKTQSVTQFAKIKAEELSKELGKKVTIDVRSFQMSAMQPFDLSGYPMIDSNTFPGYEVQRFATPEFLIKAKVKGEEARAKGEEYFLILFFDEWNRARPEMHNAFMGYLDGRGVNGHEIPDNVYCVAAANPVTDDATYGAVTECDDQAILDRLIHINVVPTSSEFTNFLYGEKRAHDAVQAFLEEDKERLPNNGFKGITGDIRKTNRGYVDVAKAVSFLVAEKNSETRRTLIEAVAKGILGEHAGSLFAERFGQCEFLTTPEELILKGSSDAFAKIKDSVGRDDNNENRLDRVSKVTQNIIRFLNAEGREELNKTQLKRLNRYLKLVPHDQAEQILSKAKFTETELIAGGMKKKTEETLQVTSEVTVDPTWR